MLDFAAARRMMVDCQVRTSDVTDLRLIAAMLTVPRERFASKESAELAYLDADLPVERGAAADEADGVVQAPAGGRDWRDRPRPHRRLRQRLFSGGDRASCRLGGRARAGRRHSRNCAKDNLQALGAHNATVVTGPLVGGWPAAAPYDVILLDGAVEDVPQALLRQLKDDGRLLGVVGRPPLSKAMLFRSTGVESSSRLIFDATAPALPGFAKPHAFVF